jgi:hypothetical protein
MSAFRRLGIGAKITVGLLVFLIILAVATSWLVQRGFSQAEQSAVQRSAGSLQSQSQESLIQLTSLEAQLYDVELQQAASMTEIAASYVVDAHTLGQQMDWATSSTRVVWSGSQLTRSPDGLLYYDADPRRRTEVMQPGNIPPDERTERSLSDTVILDELFPSL